MRLTFPVVTMWGSHVLALSAILNTKTSTQYVVLESATVLEMSVGGRADVEKKSRTMLNAVGDPHLWNDVETVVSHLFPVMVSTHL